MEISSHAFTSRGCRENNEDAFAVSAIGNVWVVADGLGGHASGEIASQTAAGYVIKTVEHTVSFPDNEIISLILSANKVLVNKQKDNPAWNGMRTTIVAAFASEGVLRYIHVGDSRFYYFKNNKIYIQSVDHSVSQMAVQFGEITPEQIRFHEDRNKLLKVLGGDEELNIRNVDGEIKMEEGDAFLLCTDGFWELIWEREMEIDLLKAFTPQVWLETMIARILPRLNRSSDNFTAVCCFIH